MNINATLLGQMLVFGILIWFSWKFIWPPLTKAIEDRQKKIAEGLAAAERGQKELQQCARRGRGHRQRGARQGHEDRRPGEPALEARSSTKHASTAICERAAPRRRRAAGSRSSEQSRARDELRKDVATLAVAGASRLLEREIDPKAHADLIEQARPRDRGRQGLTAAAPRTSWSNDAWPKEPR